MGGSVPTNGDCFGEVRLEAREVAYTSSAATPPISNWVETYAASSSVQYIRQRVGLHD